MGLGGAEDVGNAVPGLGYAGGGVGEVFLADAGGGNVGNADDALNGRVEGAGGEDVGDLD